jgi:hypothetical protein
MPAFQYLSGSNEGSLAPQFKWLDNIFKRNRLTHGDRFCVEPLLDCGVYRIQSASPVCQHINRFAVTHCAQQPHCDNLENFLHSQRPLLTLWL